MKFEQEQQIIRVKNNLNNSINQYSYMGKTVSLPEYHQH